MSLRIDSTTSKIVLGFAAGTALAVGTVLYLRSHRNAPAAASLDKGRFTFLANVPLVGRVYTHFNPTKPALAELPNITLGSTSERIGTIDALKAKLSEVKQQHKELGALVIYGDATLKINEDPGILALNPMKLILVGPHIVHEPAPALPGRLDEQMIDSGWYSKNLTFREFPMAVQDPTQFTFITVIEVASVQEALDAKLPINPETSKLLRTIYSVKA